MPHYRRKEHEKHIEELLSHPNAPQLHTSMSRTKKMSADVKKWYQPSPAHNREVKRLTQKGPLSGNNVRFDTTPTVHILEVLNTIIIIKTAIIILIVTHKWMQLVPHWINFIKEFQHDCGSMTVYAGFTDRRRGRGIGIRI